ncbi:MAG: FHA domain-containing protein [Polyangiales bacterium]
MGVRIAVQSLWAKGEPSTFVYEFDQPRIVIGRSRSADVQLPHPAVSATHASIRIAEPGYVLVDEGSTNGSRVNEAPVATGRPKSLVSHDQIDLGGFRLSIEFGVPVVRSMSTQQTSDYAAEMLRERHADEPEASLHARLQTIQNGADESVPLLPIAKAAPSEPPPPRASRPSIPASWPSRPRLGTSELMVYSMAGLLLAASLLIMFLLTRP